MDDDGAANEFSFFAAEYKSESQSRTAKKEYKLKALAHSKHQLTTKQF